MRSRIFLTALLAVAVSGIHVRSAAAQETVKVGIVIPMTGTSAAVGREISDAAKLYVAQHGNTVAGKKIELIIRDDQSVPDNAKRLAQELIVNDKVNLLGAGLTPSAMSMAPIATEGKVPTVVMVSGTSVVTDRSPYYVRTDKRARLRGNSPSAASTNPASSSSGRVTSSTMTICRQPATRSLASSPPECIRRRIHRS